MLDIVRQAVPSAVEVVPLSGGQLGTVFSVRRAAPDPPLIVKIYAEKARWRQEKEAHVYQLLASHNVGPTPSIVDMLPDGVSVMTQLPGRPLASLSLTSAQTQEVYRQMGALLARIHTIGQPAFGYLTTSVLDPQPTNSAYMSRQFTVKLRDFLAYGGDPVLHEAMSAYVAARSSLFSHCAAPVLCHNDFHSGNVLVGDDGVITGFIDVENASAADPLMDLAKTDYYSADATGLLAGYGDLPASWADRLAIYRLYHALELWAWYASIGNTEPLPGIASDIRSMTNGERA